MPKLRFALDRGGPKRLEVSWSLGWKQFRVLLDGAEVGSAANKEELRAGREFELPDASRLQVRLAKQLELIRNGKPLPGSAGDPVTALNASAGIIYFIGGGSFVVGILAMVLPDSQLGEIILGWPTALTGAVLVLLGYFVKRRSAAALGMVVAVVACLLLWRVIGSVAVLSEGGVPMGLGGIFLGACFLVLICRGFRAIRELENQEAEESRVSAPGQ